MNFKELFDLEDDAARERLEGLLSDHFDSDWLDSFCRDGGYPEVDELVVDHFERSESGITGRISVGFSEVIATSCSDVDLNDKKSCSFDITIDRDGEVELGEFDEGWDGEEYGEQEFDDDFDDVEVDEPTESDEF